MRVWERKIERQERERERETYRKKGKRDRFEKHNALEIRTDRERKHLKED